MVMGNGEKTRGKKIKEERYNMKLKKKKEVSGGGVEKGLKRWVEEKEEMKEECRHVRKETGGNKEKVKEIIIMD